MKDLITEILMHIQTHLSDELTIEEVANHFGYSKYHFSREFKRHTGFSASDYLSSLKIEKAKQELLKKDHNITNSSFDVGYASLGTFSTTFTKKTGLSPREYELLVTKVPSFWEHLYRTFVLNHLFMHKLHWVRLLFDTGYAVRPVSFFTMARPEPVFIALSIMQIVPSLCSRY